MIKAIFFDVDGTLVSFKTHKIPEDTRQALRLAAANGIKLFVATGRQHLEAERVLPKELFDGFIALNGQYCYAGKEMVRKQAIDPGDLRVLVERLSHDPYPCEFVEENRLYMNMVNDTVRKSHGEVALGLPPVEDISGVPNREIFQIVAFFDASQEEAEMSLLPHCEATRWSPLFTDIVPKGGSKRVGIEAMLRHFGLTAAEAMAFGDGGNDIPMLRYVSTGIAMGNASPDVKAAADDTTDSVDEGGVYHALKRYHII